MMKKIIKYTAVVVLVGLIAYNSVYFKSLSKMKAEATEKSFNATNFAKNYLNKDLLPSINQLPNFDEVLMQLKSNPKDAFKQHANALAIGNVRFFMIKGEGTVTSIKENEIVLTTTGKNTLTVATEFIFGNALRDASGIIKVEDFSNSTDLNNVSAEVNKIVREEILPPFKSKVKTGDKVLFAGAFELNQEHIDLNQIEIVPVKLSIQ